MKLKKNEVYCVKCRSSCRVQKPKLEYDRRSRLRMKGVCSTCNTKCYKYVSSNLEK